MDRRIILGVRVVLYNLSMFYAFLYPAILLVVLVYLSYWGLLWIPITLPAVALVGSMLHMGFTIISGLYIASFFKPKEKIFNL